MSERIQAIRGMRDVLPEESYSWRLLERIFSDCVLSYGYREVRMPILESTQLFKRSIGEITDIVEKEMYTFTDRNGDSLSLRPEGTAGCVRACLEHGLLHVLANDAAEYQLVLCLQHVCINQWGMVGQQS